MKTIPAYYWNNKIDKGNNEDEKFEIFLKKKEKKRKGIRNVHLKLNKKK